MQVRGVWPAHPMICFPSTLFGFGFAAAFFLRTLVLSLLLALAFSCFKTVTSHCITDIQFQCRITSEGAGSIELKKSSNKKSKQWAPNKTSDAPHTLSVCNAVTVHMINPSYRCLVVTCLGRSIIHWADGPLPTLPLPLPSLPCTPPPSPPPSRRSHANPTAPAAHAIHAACSAAPADSAPQNAATPGPPAAASTAATPRQLQNANSMVTSLVTSLSPTVISVGVVFSATATSADARRFSIGE
jgi:hypothetical protein